jgi:hypothetical protein
MRVLQWRNPERIALIRVWEPPDVGVIGDGVLIASSCLAALDEPRARALNRNSISDRRRVFGPRVEDESAGVADILDVAGDQAETMLDRRGREKRVDNGRRLSSQ